MKYITALFCWLMAFSCMAQTQGGEYFHVPEKQPAINLAPAEKWIAVGDRAHKATFCEATSPMHCFKLQDFAFAVPKKNDLPESWTHDGQTYRVVQKLSPHAEHQAWVIEKTTGQRWWFLWSMHHGLTMFGDAPKKNQGGGYLVHGSCGFAASESCK